MCEKLFINGCGNPASSWGINDICIRFVAILKCDSQLCLKIIRVLGACVGRLASHHHYTVFRKNCLKFHHIIHDTTASMHQQVPCTRKKMISWAHCLLRAVKSLQLLPDKYDVIITSSATMNI